MRRCTLFSGEAAVSDQAESAGAWFGLFAGANAAHRAGLLLLRRLVLAALCVGLGVGGLAMKVVGLELKVIATSVPSPSSVKSKRERKWDPQESASTE